PIASLPQIRIQTAIGRKITPQRILGIALREAGHHTEPRSADSVNHTEIEAFGKGTLLRRNVFRLYVKDLRGRDRMKIGTGDECIDELLVIRKSSEDPQFDLRIIGDHESASLTGSKAAPVFTFVRYLLEIRIRARETAAWCAYLTKICVNSSGGRLNEFENILTEARDSFCHSSIFE